MQVAIDQHLRTYWWQHCTLQHSHAPHAPGEVTTSPIAIDVQHDKHACRWPAAHHQLLRRIATIATEIRRHPNVHFLQLQPLQYSTPPQRLSDQTAVASATGSSPRARDQWHNQQALRSTLWHQLGALPCASHAKPSKLAAMHLDVLMKQPFIWCKHVTQACFDVLPIKMWKRNENRRQFVHVCTVIYSNCLAIFRFFWSKSHLSLSETPAETCSSPHPLEVRADSPSSASAQPISSDWHGCMPAGWCWRWWCPWRLHLQWWLWWLMVTYGDLWWLKSGIYPLVNWRVCWWKLNHLVRGFADYQWEFSMAILNIQMVVHCSGK